MSVLGDHNHTVIPIQNYLNHLSSLKYSQRSIESYAKALNRFHSFLTARKIMRIAYVTSEHLDTYRLELLEKQYSGHSIVLYLRTVRNLFNFLETTQQIFINPAASMVIPGVRGKMQPVPTEKDMEKLLARPDVTTPVGIRDRALIETFYSTGVRLEEMTGMRLFDVSGKNDTVKVVGKGSKERLVPLGKKAVEWLKRYIKEVRPRFLKGKADQHSLWLGVKGKKIHPLIVERIVRDYGKAAGIKCRITPHSLRRACATHMLANGAHPVQIQLLLGHATLSTLSHYLKITITDMMKMHRKGKLGK